MGELPSKCGISNITSFFKRGKEVTFGLVSVMVKLHTFIPGIVGDTGVEECGSIQMHICDNQQCSFSLV